jgi:hypothetical protein
LISLKEMMGVFGACAGEAGNRDGARVPAKIKRKPATHRTVAESSLRIGIDFRMPPQQRLYQNTLPTEPLQW